MTFELNQEEIDHRMASLPGMREPEAGAFDSFFSGTGRYAMQGLAKTGRAVDLLGAVGPIIQDKFSGGTEAQDRYFQEHNEIFGHAVDYWTPKPSEVGVAGQVVGQLLGTLPQIVASPATAIALTAPSVAEDLALKGVESDKALAAGGVQAAGLGLGIWVPILGKTLAQRMLLGGAGFNVAQGMVTRGATGSILEGTAAENDFKAMDATGITLDALLGLAFGGLAHVRPDMRAQGEAWHKRLEDWAAKLKPSDVDALVTLRQAQHLSADSMPGRPVDMIDQANHVARIRKAIDDLAADRPVSVEDMPASRFEADPVRQAQELQITRTMADEGKDSGLIDEHTYQSIRDDVIGDLPRGVESGGKKAIQEVIEFAKSGSANEKKGVRFAPVDDKTALEISQRLGSDVAGYQHLIDNFGVRHALREHGNSASEAKRGNIAITEADFLKVPDIVRNYDSIERGGTDAIGRPLVRYVKTLKDGTVYYVEEIRTGRKELALKTMWKKPSARGMLPDDQVPAPLTSETLRGLNESIDQKPQTPLAAEAARFAAENPDLSIALGKNADGSDITTTPAKLLEDANAAMKRTQDDVKLLEVAATCLLGAS